MTQTKLHNPLTPPLPAAAGQRLRWTGLKGSGLALALAAAAAGRTGPTVVLTTDMPSATRLSYDLRFYLGHGETAPILTFPDWETLPYDNFSPHQDIISERLEALYRLPDLVRGVLIVPVATTMHRLAPSRYLQANSLLLSVGDGFDLESMRRKLEGVGYRCVSQVMEHGEYAVRGGLMDLCPMGSRLPYRVELLGDEVDTIRTFDPESQRSVASVQEIRLLPAREFPLDEGGITAFRQSYRAQFEGDPRASTIYRDVSQGIAPPGIEYYLPLFHEQTDTLYDYLPPGSLVVSCGDVHAAAEEFQRSARQRYESRRHDSSRPLLAPERLFLQANEVFGALAAWPVVSVELHADGADARELATLPPPELNLDVRAAQPAGRLQAFVAGFEGRVLFCAETAGRREALLQTLARAGLQPQPFETWQAFLASEGALGITVASLEQGLLLESPPIAVVAESQLFGPQVLQRRRRKDRAVDSDAVVRNLAELSVGSPVVHEDHGVGRYLGLQRLQTGGLEAEFLTLEYAGGDKLYVPVSSLHLISRYTGVSPEAAPLHRLGSDRWARAKRKAAERVCDVAAELLDIYARRAARQGTACHLDAEAYAAFTAAFPFEETPDQLSTIEAVIADMVAPQPMDRLVCGDVGFGKTEVAMRAAFAATHDGKQVCLVVPTTLLAQQHYENFKDRFADWPVRIEVLSRFVTRKQQEALVRALAEGRVDIVIGTHKLLQGKIRFKRLGLVIIDEEHRFGVRQKEQLKALRAEVDVLTLTATPIPRTLNMSLTGIRDLSIIATPPARRLAIKTFVREWSKPLIYEACLRELQRGGQIYFLHNEVETIERSARELQALVPEATVRIGHGQMRERELEQVMSDFYHQRFNVLVCTTIIESGIDIPSANTIIINRADKLGLAQLYQLRGRVGRSHHRAYAYLLTPQRRALSADAVKRLDAIEALEELGVGFTLATHDLEIRGAGELLGEEQSGQIQEIGFSLYSELLERAVHALRSGHAPDLERPAKHAAEIDLQVPALIPDDYLPDVHTRLMLYKRIASVEDAEQLRELQVEMIDRFGLLPEPVKTLFRLTELKLKARPLGIRKIEAGKTGGRIIFHPEPPIDPMRVITLLQTQSKVYKLDGRDRLRFSMPLADTSARLDAVDGLLTTLGAREAA